MRKGDLMVMGTMLVFGEFLKQFLGSSQGNAASSHASRQLHPIRSLLASR